MLDFFKKLCYNYIIRLERWLKDMARKTKCPICSVYFDRDLVPFVHMKNRYYHEACMGEKEKLDQYVMKLFNKKAVPVKVSRQIESYVNTHEFTYYGIRMSLNYFYGIRDNSLAKANGGIGIVPHIYDQAGDYYKGINEYKKNASLENVDQFVEVKKIKIRPPQTTQEKKEIDIAKL